MDTNQMPNLPTSTILVVDDAPATLKMLSEQLENSGYRVVVARDGQEAIQRAGLVIPDLILLDIMLPRMNGYETCLLLKNDEKTRGIPVIFMTSMVTTESKVRGFEAGGVDFVSKPVEMEELLARLKTHLTLHALQGQLELRNRRLQTEIAERRRAEQALLFSEEKYRSLVENINDVIFSLDNERRFDYVSPLIEQLTGFGVDEIMGLSFDRLVHPDDISAIRADFEQTLAGNPKQSEFRVLAKGGGVLHVRTSSRPLVEYGRLSGLTGVMADITERKRVETALIEAHAELERRVEERTTDLARANERLQADIAERKRAEDELFKSRQMLQIVLDTIPQRVFWKDRDLVYVGCNKTFAEDCGYADPAELIGKTDYETASAATADLYRADDRHVMDTNIAKLDYEEPQIKPDGSRAWLLTSKAPLHHKDGEVIGVLGTYEDITERKRAEDALRESETRLAEIIDFLPDATFAVDGEGKVIAWNRAIEEMTGLKAEEMLGKGDYEYSLPFYGVRRPILIDLVFDDNAEIAQKYHSISKEGNVLVAENMVRIRGVDQALFAKAAPLYDSKGNPVGAIESIRDISERVLAESKIRAHAEELLAINRIAMACTSSLELEPILERALDETLKIVGLDGGAICLVRPDNTLELVVHRALPETVAQHLANNRVAVDECIRSACVLEGLPRILPDHESVIRCPASGAFSDDTIQFHAAFPLIIQKECVGVLCLFTRHGRIPGEQDLKLIETVSAQLALGMQNALLYREIHRYAETLEEKVRQRTMQFEIANKELESFSYSVSHDLRAPLRGIDGWSQALVEDCLDKIDQQGRDYLERIRTETQRMGKLIDGLLELSRVSRSDMKRELVNLSATASSIADRLMESNPERCVEFVIQEELGTYGDPRLLEVMMANLLGNAWKFTSTHACARIEFGRTVMDGRTVWFVRDDGAGFDMAYAAKLFGPFQRMHRLSEFPGNGIGLATVQRIVHRHGGRVWAEARVEEGASFYFTL